MKVVIVGGTHGNEKTGAYLVEKWRRRPQCLPSEHQYLLLVGNPEALNANQRFLDYDLNRSFSKDRKGSDNNVVYEWDRAALIRQQVSEWSGGEPVFLIDLHTTTSQMGKNLVLSKSDRLSALMARQVLAADPETHLIFNSQIDADCPFVDSIAPHGLLVEVGPVAHNQLHPVRIAETERIVLLILQALAQHSGDPGTELVEVTGFQELGPVLYPVEPAQNQVGQTIIRPWLIHPHLQGRDFFPLSPGDPLFLGIDGAVRTFAGPDTVFPIFINEVSYQADGTAFLKTARVSRPF